MVYNSHCSNLNLTSLQAQSSLEYTYSRKTWTHSKMRLNHWSLDKSPKIQSQSKQCDSVYNNKHDSRTRLHEDDSRRNENFSGCSENRIQTSFSNKRVTIGTFCSELENKVAADSREGLVITATIPRTGQSVELKMSHRKIRRFSIYLSSKCSIIIIVQVIEDCRDRNNFGAYVREKLNMNHRYKSDGYYDPRCRHGVNDKIMLVTKVPLEEKAVDDLKSIFGDKLVNISHKRMKCILEDTNSSIRRYAKSWSEKLEIVTIAYQCLEKNKELIEEIHLDSLAKDDLSDKPSWSKETQKPKDAPKNSSVDEKNAKSLQNHSNQSESPKSDVIRAVRKKTRWDSVTTINIGNTKASGISLNLNKNLVRNDVSSSKSHQVTKKLEIMEANKEKSHDNEPRRLNNPFLENNVSKQQRIHTWLEPIRNLDSIITEVYANKIAELKNHASNSTHKDSIDGVLEDSKNCTSELRHDITPSKDGQSRLSQPAVTLIPDESSRNCPKNKNLDLNSGLVTDENEDLSDSCSQGSDVLVIAEEIDEMFEDIDGLRPSDNDRIEKHPQLTRPEISLTTIINCPKNKDLDTNLESVTDKNKDLKTVSDQASDVPLIEDLIDLEALNDGISKSSQASNVPVIEGDLIDLEALNDCISKSSQASDVSIIKGDCIKSDSEEICSLTPKKDQSKIKNQLAESVVSLIADENFGPESRICPKNKDLAQNSGLKSNENENSEALSDDVLDSSQASGSDLSKTEEDLIDETSELSSNSDSAEIDVVGLSDDGQIEVQSQAVPKLSPTQAVASLTTQSKFEEPQSNRFAISKTIDKNLETISEELAPKTANHCCDSTLENELTFKNIDDICVHEPSKRQILHARRFRMKNSIRRYSAESQLSQNCKEGKEDKVVMSDSSYESKKNLSQRRTIVRRKRKSNLIRDDEVKRSRGQYDILEVERRKLLEQKTLPLELLEKSSVKESSGKIGDCNLSFPKPEDVTHQKSNNVSHMDGRIILEIKLEDYPDVHRGLIWSGKEFSAHTNACLVSHPYLGPNHVYRTPGWDHPPLEQNCILETKESMLKLVRNTTKVDEHNTVETQTDS